MKPFIPIGWLVFAIPVCVQAQYRSDRPLEMSFEQSDFFFSPSFLNPLGAEHFQTASVLTSDDPMNALEGNPANLSNFDRDTLPGSYLYLDFRNIPILPSIVFRKGKNCECLFCPWELKLFQDA